MYGSAQANWIATRRNELQTFLVDTTHAPGHSTFTQQVMQMLSVQANSLKKHKNNLADLASQWKVWLCLQNAVVQGVCPEILRRDRKGRQVWVWNELICGQANVLHSSSSVHPHALSLSLSLTHTHMLIQFEDRELVGLKVNTAHTQTQTHTHTQQQTNKQNCKQHQWMSHQKHEHNRSFSMRLTTAGHDNSNWKTVFFSQNLTTSPCYATENISKVWLTVPHISSSFFDTVT